VTKQANTIKIYTHKDPGVLEEILTSGDVHRGDEVGLVALNPGFIDDLAGSLSRKPTWDVLRSDGVLYVTSGDDTFETPIRERTF
jgi:hypothetical protein